MVNCFHWNLVRNEHKIQKSVAYHCVECKTRIAKMCRLYKFVLIFGQFCFKCATYSLNGAWVPCSNRPVGVTRTCFIDSYVLMSGFYVLI